LQLFSFGGSGLALAALALMDFGAIECPPFFFFFMTEAWQGDLFVYLILASTQLG